MVTTSELTSAFTSVTTNLLDRYKKLNFWGKLFVWVYALVNVAILLTILIIGPRKLFNWLAEQARLLESIPYGWVVLLVIFISTGFPPVPGYGTLVTITGFVYGVYPGWFIAAGGCLLASSASFIICRLSLQRFLRFLEKDKTFKALGVAVRIKGFPLVLLIRLCPFPFSYSNLFFSSIESVSFPQFFFSTVLITPKLLVHVFLGSRLFLLSDPEESRKMDNTSKILNACYIIVGTIVSIATGWYVWRVTQRFIGDQVVGEGNIDDQDSEAILGGGVLPEDQERLLSEDDLEEQVQKRKERVQRYRRQDVETNGPLKGHNKKPSLLEYQSDRGKSTTGLLDDVDIENDQSTS